MIGLVRTLLILIGLYMVIRFFSRLIGLITHKPSSQQGHRSSSDKPRRKKDRDDGEYVDYEEIK
jgi:hypothetical protein